MRRVKYMKRHRIKLSELESDRSKPVARLLLPSCHRDAISWGRKRWGQLVGGGASDQWRIFLMKNRTRHLFLVVTLVLGMIVGISQPTRQLVAAASSTIESPQTDIAGKAGLAVEVDSGQILAAKNIDTVLPIASLTKMLSLYHGIVQHSVRRGSGLYRQRIVRGWVGLLRQRGGHGFG